jgi:hypothetical protein
MKTLMIICMTLVTLSVSAQEFKPFKVNVSLGYAHLMGKEASGGVLAAVEPKVGLGDNFDLGLRMELAGANRIILFNGQSNKTEIKFFGSYLLTGTIYLSRSDFRPYIGAGAGVYRFAGATFDAVNDNEEYTLDPSQKFGSMIRGGFKAKHFNAGVEYNTVSPSKYNIQGQMFEGKNSYLAIKLGFDIGGGRR